MRIVRIALQSVVAGLLVVGLLPRAATGAEGDQLKVFGYLTSAVATPVAFQYDQPSFGVPASPTFEVRYMHSEAHLDSGPAGRALSSIMWPGDLAGNAPPALVFDTFLPRDLITVHPQENSAWEAFRREIIAGSESSPSYPIRAESFYPQSPHASSYPVGGGIDMTSSASERTAEAMTTGSNATFPGLFEARHLNSKVFAGVRDGIAVAEAVATAKEMDLFGGVIKVQGFRSTKLISSDGHTATVEGSLQISALIVNGVRVLSIGDDGPKIGDQAVDWSQAMQALDQLAAQGFTIKLAQDTKSIVGPDGRSRVFGMSIRMDARGMEQLPDPIRSYLRSPGSSPAKPAYDALPGTGQGFADSFGAGDQSLTVLLGDVSVATVASPPFTIPDPEVPPVDGGGFPPIPTGPTVTLPPSDTGTTPPTGGAGQRYNPPARPVADSKGVSTPLTVMSFLLAAGATAGLRVFADKATCAPGAAGPRCTLQP